VKHLHIARKHLEPRIVFTRHWMWLLIDKEVGTQRTTSWGAPNAVAECSVELFSNPQVCNFSSHRLSCTSLLRPGRFLVCRALTHPISTFGLVARKAEDLPCARPSGRGGAASGGAAPALSEGSRDDQPPQSPPLVAGEGAKRERKGEALTLHRRQFEAYLDKVFDFSARVATLPEGRQSPRHPWPKVFDSVFLGGAI